MPRSKGYDNTAVARAEIEEGARFAMILTQDDLRLIEILAEQALTRNTTRPVETILEIARKAKERIQRAQV